MTASTLLTGLSISGAEGGDAAAAGGAAAGGGSASAGAGSTANGHGAGAAGGEDTSIGSDGVHFDRVVRRRGCLMTAGACDGRYLMEFFTGGAASEPPSNAARRAVSEGETAEAAAERQRESSRLWALDQMLVLGRAGLRRGRPADLAPRGQKPKKGAKGGADDGAAPMDVSDAAAEAEAPFKPIAPLGTLRFYFFSAFWQWADGATAGSPLVDKYGGLASPPLSATMRKGCADRFFSLLGEVCAAFSSAAASAANAEGGGKSAASDEAELAAFATLESVGEWWAELQKGGATLVTPLTKPESATLAASRKAASSLRKRRLASAVPGGAAASPRLTPAASPRLGPAASPRLGPANGAANAASAPINRKLRALELFSRHMQLQLLLAPGAAAGALDEIGACVRELDSSELKCWRTGEAAASSGANMFDTINLGDTMEAAEKPSVGEVVVDLVLSVLVQPSSTLRDVCKVVVRAFGDELGAEAMGLFTRVLRPSAEDEEDEEDSDDESDDDSDDESDDDSDVEEVDDEDEDEEDEEGGGLDDAAEYARLQAAMDRALEKRETGEDEASEASDASDEEMPEDPKRMAAVDRQLAAMVRLRMERTTAKKEKVQQQLHFKLRILDLLDALARRAAPPPALLLLPLPLLRLIVSCAAVPAERPLVERTAGLLRGRISKVNFHGLLRGAWPAEAVAPATLLEHLTEIITLAERLRVGGAEVATSITESIALLLRIMVQHRMICPRSCASSAEPVAPSDKKKGKKRAVGDSPRLAPAAPPAGAEGELHAEVVSLLSGMLRRFYTQKNCRIHTKLVGEVLKRQPALGWELGPVLIEMVSGARDGFLCGEACAHLELLVAQRGSSADGVAPLVSAVPALGASLSSLFGRDGVKPKHLLPPLKLGHAALRALAKAEPGAARELGGTLVAAVEAVRRDEG